ncbi:tRNA (adenosine(37)-N6)-dimethylallyltransferase MiaA [Candidatus Poriferisocius sp.]|uniref:tRNA (adenosine(37)-N6)-dimethylallyltransferase MiaA n=1 Tax=Candidatus Poriferisocius sp. TaxID=3101276 RepID=UPI003B0231B1
MAHSHPGGRALSSSPPSDAVGAPGALAIVGVTATGKSAVAVAVARQLGNAEIISVDSMQVYREMDIGTDKPPAALRAEVPHHLVDVADPAEDYSLTMFQAAGRQARADIATRGRTAVLVGGTGLYHRAVIDDLEIPGRYPATVAILEQEPDTEALHHRLVELDPLAASRMEPTNRRRILRALEVTVGSGRPFSSYGPGLGDYPPCNIAQIGLSLSRAEIDHRIEQRYHQQMEAGFLAEVEALAHRQPPLSRTASQALGYKELLGHLNGEMSLDEALDLAIARTRKFARRQERWFRRDPRIVWLSADNDAEALAGEALFCMTQHESPG